MVDIISYEKQIVSDDEYEVWQLNLPTVITVTVAFDLGSDNGQTE